MSRRQRQRPAAPRARNRRTAGATNRLRIQLHSCPRGWADIVRRAVRLALRMCRHAHGARAGRLPVGAVSIAFVSDDQIAVLNESWLRHVGPTDVLTFDLREALDADHIDGQIVVSLDTARREARRRGHAPRDEALLYIVHAVLHLLGYDDQRAAPRRRMHEREDEVLHALGVGRVYHPRRGRTTRAAPAIQATKRPPRRLGSDEGEKVESRKSKSQNRGTGNRRQPRRHSAGGDRNPTGARWRRSIDEVSRF